MADLITFVTETGQIIRGSVMGAFEDDLSGKNYVIYTCLLYTSDAADE